LLRLVDMGLDGQVLEEKRQKDQGGDWYGQAGKLGAQRPSRPHTG
jgi:hypothetical protein